MRLSNATLIVFTATDIVVIGQDPEYADYDNPRGERYGVAATVIAEAPDGSRWAYEKTWTKRWPNQALAPAERFRLRVEAALAAGYKLRERHWVEIQPAYGSEAYDRGGWEAINAHHEREADRHA